MRYVNLGFARIRRYAQTLGDLSVRQPFDIMQDKGRPFSLWQTADRSRQRDSHDWP